MCCGVEEKNSFPVLVRCVLHSSLSLCSPFNVYHFTSVDLLRRRRRSIFFQLIIEILSLSFFLSRKSISSSSVFFYIQMCIRLHSSWNIYPCASMTTMYKKKKQEKSAKNIDSMFFSDRRRERERVCQARQNDNERRRGAIQESVDRSIFSAKRRYLSNFFFFFVP